jgi:photosystem II stability/assembly factor-like uncharacterized protein
VSSPLVEEMDDIDLFKEEKANISILNGSGMTGLASKTSDYLTGLGGNVIVTGDAGQFYNQTTIVDFTGNPYTVSYLASLMGVQTTFIRTEYRGESELDVVVYLGADWGQTNQLP